MKINCRAQEASNPQTVAEWCGKPAKATKTQCLKTVRVKTVREPLISKIARILGLA